MLIFSIIISAFYFLWALIIVIGWRKSFRPLKTIFTSNLPFISVVIALRNEAANIDNLLKCLQNQTYPKEKLEIILVDDHSIDNSLAILTKTIDSLENLVIIDLPEEKSGKKAAISLGVSRAKGELIVNTDGDCEMGEYWLASFADFYHKYQSDMVLGPVALMGNSIWAKLQQLEFTALQAVTAGMAGFQRPIMCNGANLVFKKELFNDAFLNKKYASGDDVFLMLKLKSEDRKIRYHASKQAIVRTNATENLSSFLAQRIRWTSKSAGYKDFDVIATALFVFSVNFILLFLLVWAIFSQNWNCFFVLFISKMISDFLILVPTLRFFYQCNLIFLIPFSELFIMFYTLIIPVLGLVWNPKWKRRI